jgi:transposase
VLTGIVFVLRLGIAWNLLPQEMGCGSGTACWRRLVAWQEGKFIVVRLTLPRRVRRAGIAALLMVPRAMSYVILIYAAR